MTAASGSLALIVPDPRPVYEDSTMHIQFSDDLPTYDSDDFQLHFIALIDARPVVCSISAEALEDVQKILVYLEEQEPRIVAKFESDYRRLSGHS